MRDTDLTMLLSELGINTTSEFSRSLEKPIFKDFIVDI